MCRWFFPFDVFALTSKSCNNEESGMLIAVAILAMVWKLKLLSPPPAVPMKELWRVPGG